jgi:hypothetical protein
MEIDEHSIEGSDGIGHYDQSSWLAREIVPSGVLTILIMLARVEKVRPDDSWSRRSE